MAGYSLSPFFFFAFLWTDTKSRSIKTQKKRNKAMLTEQAWSIKDLLYDLIFKLKLQQQNKTQHGIVLLVKKNSSNLAGIRFIFSAFLDL